MSNKKILKVMKFQGLDRVKVHFMVRCHVLSVLGWETNKNKRIIKESFLLFSRDKLILDKQVRSILFELFWLFLSHTYESSGVSFSIINSSMLVFKISKPLLPVDELPQPESQNNLILSCRKNYLLLIQYVESIIEKSCFKFFRRSRLRTSSRIYQCSEDMKICSLILAFFINLSFGIFYISYYQHFFTFNLL